MKIRLFLQLVKIRIVLLVLWTVWVGMRVAGGGPLTLMVGILLGVGMAAAGSAALNQWMDRDVDGRMIRTRNRPIPSGQIPSRYALIIGLVLVVSGVAITTGFSLKAGMLTALTVFLYTPLYTWYKRRSPHSAVLGSLIGALPPAIGVVAVHHTWRMEATLLASLLFLWQPAHFWALSRMRRDDYAEAQIPVLPVLWGERWTDLQMLLYGASLLPVVAGFPLFGLVSPIAGLWCVFLTIALLVVYGMVFLGKARPSQAFIGSNAYLLGVLLPLALAG